MRFYSSFASGLTSSDSNEAALCTTLTPLIRCPMVVWQSYVQPAPTRGRTPLISLRLSCTDNLYITFCCCTHLFPVVRWKNTKILGMDANFKLKHKDCGFDDPKLGSGLAYFVNEVAYQEHLSTATEVYEPVSCRHVALTTCLLIVPFINH